MFVFLLIFPDLFRWPKQLVGNIIHYGLPQCLEDYHQQIGRAGRDGRRARCISFIGNSDWKFWNGHVFTKYYKDLEKDDLQDILSSQEKLHQLLSGTGCRNQALLSHFGRCDEVEALRNRSACTCDICRGGAGVGFDEGKLLDLTKEALPVLEAVRVAQQLSEGQAANMNLVLQLLSGKCQTVMASCLWCCYCCCYCYYCFCYCVCYCCL